MGAIAPSINRPVKELKGFKKVFLEKEEKKSVSIEMDSKYAFSFWDEGRGSWKMEKGQYKILIGDSSQCNHFLEKTFEVGQTSWWSGL